LIVFSVNDPRDEAAHNLKMLSDCTSQEVSEARLVLDGYTVSKRKVATFARISNRLVMRNRAGHSVTLPIATKFEDIAHTWATFSRLAASDVSDVTADVLDRAKSDSPAVAPANVKWPRGLSIADLSKVDGRRALGQRITVSGFVLDEAAKPLSDTMIEIWQTNAGGRYRYADYGLDVPHDPNFRGNGTVSTDREGSYQFTTIKPGSYPNINGDVLQSSHIHYVLSGSGLAKPLFTEMYFPDDPLLPLEAIFNRDLADADFRNRLVCRFDADLTTPELGLGYRFDLVLGGSRATPLASTRKHKWLSP
jgi:protocatechuate 3,4-dioxygenase, beta subunit